MLLNIPNNVALRKESVDRNHVAVHLDTLSAVALRKESVDRNSVCFIFNDAEYLSLSARRAWIEILSKANEAYETASRSPQGERG